MIRRSANMAAKDSTYRRGSERIDEGKRKIMIMKTQFRTLLGLAGILGLAALLIAGDARAADDETRQLRVTGIGEVLAEPDMATVTLGVVSEAETAAAALKQNSQTVADIIAALKAGNIAARDMQTSNFSIQPKYIYPDRNRNEAGEPRIVGYTVSNTLSVRIRDLASTGGILDAMVTLGSNTVSGIRFGVADPDPIEDRARKAAIADARARAELYAAAANVKLGDIILISESGSQAPGPGPLLRTTMREQAMAVPVEGGELTFRSSINMIWELVD
jgi:uncharacterized protein YggE